MKKLKLMIAVCNLGNVRAETAAAVLQFASNPKYDVKVLWPQIQPLDASRNTMVQEFLNWSNDDNDRLLFWDDDIIPKFDSIDNLVNHDVGIVGGCCFMVKADDNGFMIPMPVACRLGADEKLRVFFDGDGLTEVDATGGAFLLIKRKVFVDVGTRPFEYVYTPMGSLSLVADYNFNFKAKKVGHKTYVDFANQCEHLKVTGLREFSKTLAYVANQ